MTDSTPPELPPLREPLPDRAYRAIALLLRGGLFAALLLLGGGLIAYWGQHRDATAGATIATNPTMHLLTLTSLGGGLAAGNPSAYLTLGLIVLVATPLLRVASGFYYFERGGERVLGAITLVVLALLLIGLLVVGPYVR